MDRPPAIGRSTDHPVLGVDCKHNRSALAQEWVNDMVDTVMKIADVEVSTGSA